MGTKLCQEFMVFPTQNRDIATRVDTKTRPAPLRMSMEFGIFAQFHTKKHRISTQSCAVVVIAACLVVVPVVIAAFWL